MLGRYFLLIAFLIQTPAWSSYRCTVYSEFQGREILSFACRQAHQQISIPLWNEEENGYSMSYGNTIVPMKLVHTLLLSGKCLTRNRVQLYLKVIHCQAPVKRSDLDKVSEAHLKNTPEFYSNQAIVLHDQAVGELHLNSYSFRITCEDDRLSYSPGHVSYFNRVTKEHDYLISSSRPSSTEHTQFDSNQLLETYKPHSQSLKKIEFMRDGDYPKESIFVNVEP